MSAIRLTVRSSSPESIWKKVACPLWAAEETQPLYLVTILAYTPRNDTFASATRVDVKIESLISAIGVTVTLDLLVNRLPLAHRQPLNLTDRNGAAAYRAGWTWPGGGGI